MLMPELYPKQYPEQIPEHYTAMRAERLAREAAAIIGC
jgi:hypothetical protein